MTTETARDGDRIGRSLLAAGLARGPVEVLDFLLPLWAGLALGATAGQVGALTALEALVSLVVRPVAGLAADRWQRNRVAAIGAALYALSFFGYAFTDGLSLAYVAAVAGGAGGALFWVALRAMVGEGLTRDSGVYSRLLSAEGAATWIAFVVGLSLVPRLDYPGVFALGGMVCLVAMVAIGTAGSATSSAVSTASDSAGSAPRMGQVARRLRPMLAVVAVTATAEAGIGLLLLLHLQRGFDLELGEIALVFLPGFIVYTLLPGRLHRLVVKVGRTWVLSAALITSAGLAAGLSFAPNPVIIAALWVLSSASLAAAIPIEQSVVAEASAGSLGRGMGIYESATLVGGFAGPLVAGVLYQTGGWQWACLGATVVLLGGSVAVPRAVRRVGVAEHPPVLESLTPPPVESPPAVPVPPAAVPASPTAPAPPATPEIPAPPAASEIPAAPVASVRIAEERRRWLTHLGLFLAAQVVLALIDRSWAYAAISGELTMEQIVNGNTDGMHVLLKATRIWTIVVIADTLWSWGRIALLARWG